jgi:hypothetical protein
MVGVLLLLLRWHLVPLLLRPLQLSPLQRRTRTSEYLYCMLGPRPDRFKQS